MIRTAISYFRPNGSYRATMVIFVPDEAAGETLHPDDGLSIVRKDGSVFRQENPYVTKARYTRESLVEIDGEFDGAWRLRNGNAERIPDAEKPLPTKSPLEQKLETLEAKVAVLETREAVK